MIDYLFGRPFNLLPLEVVAAQQPFPNEGCP